MAVPGDPAGSRYVLNPVAPRVVDLTGPTPS